MVYQGMKFGAKMVVSEERTAYTAYNSGTKTGAIIIAFDLILTSHSLSCITLHASCPNTANHRVRVHSDQVLVHPWFVVLG